MLKRCNGNKLTLCLLVSVVCEVCGCVVEPAVLLKGWRLICAEVIAYVIAYVNIASLCCDAYVVTSCLLHVCLRVYLSLQTCVLGIQRCDYMLDWQEDSGLALRQIEMNTVSASMAALSFRLKSFHE